MHKIGYILFFFSGIAGLIYEATWARYLKMFLGHSSYGQILTLILYMGGLGIGSFIASKYSHKFNSMFKAYAYIEIAVAVGGLLYHPLYEAMTNYFYSTHWNPQYAEAVKILFSSLLTTPLAILLGTTFPLLASGFLRQGVGEVSLSKLYFCNSIGAALGILLASYVFIPFWGSPGSLLVAVFINISIAIGFLYLSKKENKTTNINLLHNQELQTKTKTGGKRIHLWLWVSLLTGLTSFIYEIGWIRMLSLMLGSSTHSFDIMISAFIIGLAFGAWYSRKKLNPGTDHIYFLSWAQICMGFCALLTVYLYEPYFHIMNEANHFFAKSDGGYVWLNLFKYLISMMWMVPTSIFAGMTLPTLTYVVLHWSKQENATGKVYGWNTIGAITGAFAAGIILLPMLHLKWMLGLAAAFDMATGLFLLWLYKYKEGRKIWLALAWILLLLPLFIIKFDGDTLTAGVFRGYKSFSQKELKEVAHGRTATISFHESPVHYYIKTNGKPDASLSKDRDVPLGSDELTQAATAFIPMATLDKPYDAAMVGFGSGMSAYYLLSDPLLKSLDVIEIEKEMVRLARGFYPHNDWAFDDPRINIHYDDARTWFHTNQKEYDVLVSVPSNPWVSGVSSLFSHEFYTHIQRYLSQQGMLVQWLQLYEFDARLLMQILSALHQAFPHVNVYRIPNEPDIVLLASREPIQQNHLKRFYSTDRINKTFEKMQHPHEFFGEQNFVFNTNQVDTYLKTIAPNSDFYPLVDAHAERARFKGGDVKILDAFGYQDVNYLQYLDPSSYVLHQKLAWTNWERDNHKSPEYHALDAWLKCDSTPCNSDDLPKKLDWEKTYDLVKKSWKTFPMNPNLHGLSLYLSFKRWVDSKQLPQVVQLEFYFWHYFREGRWSEVAALVPQIRAEFYLHTLEANFLRAMVIAALKTRDKALFKDLFRLGVSHNDDIELVEREFIISLYKSTWK
jgi:predicted membrane-bound spermidine synthase